MIYLSFPILALLVFSTAAVVFARFAIHFAVTPIEETRRQAVELGWLDETVYNTWPKETTHVQSPFGYNLSVVYHPIEGSNRTVILTHGIGFSRYGMAKYAPLFYRRGFNVLLYDLRHHGQSGGANISFGFYEKHDLKAIVDYAFSRLGPGGIVGTLGESLGGATTLEHAAIDPRISFAIADCPYSNLLELFAYRVRSDFHISPLPMISATSMVVKLMAGWSFHQVSPIHAIEKIEAPVLLVHGKEDKYIPYVMSVKLFQAKQRGMCRLYLAPAAGHVQSVVRQPTEYDRQVEDFLSAAGCFEKTPANPAIPVTALFEPSLFSLSLAE